MNSKIAAIFRKVKLLILDVDGVLTDGRIVYTSEGHELKFFNVQDGLGVHMLKKIGIPTVIITAKASQTVRSRATDMGVEDVFEDAFPKNKAYQEVKRRYGLSDEDICFVADDLVDLSVMKQVGIGVAVDNACFEIKKSAVYITRNFGGSGAVREVSELILKSQGKWEEALKIFDYP